MSFLSKGGFLGKINQPFEKFLGKEGPLSFLDRPFFGLEGPSPWNKPTPASSFTDGQDEQSAIMDLLTGSALPSLKAKLAQQGGQIAPEDLLTMQNIYRLRAGLASDQEQQAFLQNSVGSDFFQKFASGALDDPEAFAQAQDSWYKTVGPSLAQATAGMVQNGAGAPIDEDLAMFQEQQAQQAEMAQLGYQRDSLFSLLNMLPQQARFQIIPALLEDPTYRRMLFGVGESSEPSQLQQTADLLSSFANQSGGGK